MGCDGIFDQLSNDEILKCVWMTTTNNTKAKDIHSQCGLAIDMIMKTSLIRKTLDNVTCVIISFENFNKKLFGSEPSSTTHTPIVKKTNAIDLDLQPLNNNLTPTYNYRKDNNYLTPNNELVTSPLQRKELISELTNKLMKNENNLTAKRTNTSISKKISIDVSNKKTNQGLSYNMISRIEKEGLINKKKENDYYEMSKKRVFEDQYHPSTTKNVSKIKDNNNFTTQQPIRKLPSYGYFGDK
jgi:hypothetical protein